MINFDDKRELFVDHYFIDNMNRTSLKLHNPVSAGEAIKYDQPWETDETGSGSFYTNIFQDGDVYRMYYRGHSTLLCYAESEDGINWNRPNLGLIDYQGSVQNNIIMPLIELGSGFGAFLDTNPNASKSQRIKGNMRGLWDDSTNSSNLYGYATSDSTNWSQIQDDPIILGSLPNHWDAQNIIFWSEIESKYVIYARCIVGGDGKLEKNWEDVAKEIFDKPDERGIPRFRSTARATSSDFFNWSEFTPMEYSDTGSMTPSAQLYTNQTTPYFRANHIYISLPGRIFFKRMKKYDIPQDAFDNMEGFEKYKYYGDTSDGAFMTTRAGSTRYDFTFRESFLKPGIGDENWTTRNNYPASGVIQTSSTEMSIFIQRHYAQPSAYLERMTLRLDGFSSLNAGYDEGQMLTKTLDFTGNKLELNYSTSAAGRIRVEMLDESGAPLEGYGIDDCDGLIGDEISGYVSWKGSTDLSKISGKPVKVRFVMNDADIYSLRFSD